MMFTEFSKYLKKLEQTPSRNAMTEILADLFRHSTQGEIGKICYLLQGRVVPLYEAVEFGVADKFMIRAISRAYGVSEVKINQEFKKSGDLGIAAQTCHPHTGDKGDKGNRGDRGEFNISRVYEALRQVAKESGEGSQDKKITLLAQLLQSVDPLSARYITRIPLDKLRLGFSDMTILDALSWMLAGDKSLRIQLEDAYNVRPDIGYLSDTLKSSGMKGLSHIKVKVGAPILASLCQRLPTADEMIKKMGEVAVEPKYDGVRCIGGYTGIFIRNRGYISARDVRTGDFVLTHNGNFEKITAVSRRFKQKGEVLYRLQTMLGDACVVSGDHPVLRYRNGKQSWVSIGQLNPTDWLIFPKVKPVQHKMTESLTLEDGAGYKKTIPMSEDFLRFLGFWVGDGFSNNSHQSERVGLTFNAKTEQELASEYEGIIRQTLKIRDISRNERNGGLNIYWRDSLFRMWLCKEFRYHEKGEHGKCIPEWMFSITRKQFFAFVLGWIDADGTPRNSWGNKITTKEHRLAFMAVVLGSVFGYPIGVRKVRVPLENETKKTYYELIVSGTDRYIKKLDRSYAIKIGSIQKTTIHPRAYLYDFQVEGDKSYCSSLMALHNCQIHVFPKGVRVFSRNLENTTAMFPELQHIGNQLTADEVILDGEAIGVDPKTGKFIPFQETMTRKRKHEIALALKNVPLKFYIFDILYLDGQELLNKPFSDRRKVLEHVVNKGNLLVVSPQIVTSNANDIRRYHDEQIKKGLEGAVVKKWASPYEPGRRGFSWVKFKEEEGKTGKLTDTIDGVVMGYYRGEGKRSGFGIGAFLVGVKKGEQFVTITKIGTGVSDELWRELKKDFSRQSSVVRPKEYSDVHKMFIPDVWIHPTIVVEIAGDDLTKSPTHGAGVAIRFPRLVRIRSDKSPNNVTTVHEIRHMYKNQ